MKLIERYIFRRAAIMFLATLLPLLGIVWTTQALANVNLVTDSGQSVLAFLKLATLILPSVVPIILPFALVIGVTQTLSAMNSDSELTVLSAAGSSRMSIIRPVLYLAAGLSVLSFAIDNFVEPYSRVAVRKMIATAHADLLSSVVQENSFRKITDGLYVQVGARRSGGVLHGIFVADSRNPNFELVYYAREGAVDEKSSALVMKDGEVHRKLPEGGVSVIKFDSYAFDLTDMTKSAGEANIRPKDRDLFYLVKPDPEDPALKRTPLVFTAELHRRFTEWSYPLLFGLIALVISSDARSHREARVHPTISAVGAALIIRWMTFYAANSAEDSVWFVPLMYLVPLMTGALAIRQLASNRRLYIPTSWHDKLSDLIARIRHSRAGADAGQAS
ncbi:LPS export ABC transporter permease LptF [Sinorhizobium alkalisoli]|uniref:LPS export ABC transporter permease LptF n=1 Tax=Sinorhizobium alkalisoli TaxID=1752398 RepID=A0A1E3V6L7_9HYPH|nr:LPS export ABC transporter permease LptF [Sinorhizobium alkalisoli]MCA1493678.1 LPS export ABC transporter permease LptF [Ensifer sp. NBAIM29]MCG5478050.1 LPS export ABC transporter permease LptF [Sinorhizobium alkalisoli]ODR89210.1 LPS export ABC transporter permease LptF [Sinorhizobium alkalisoli]